MTELRPIYARLAEEQYEWLRQYCFDHKVSQAEVLRQALEMFRETKEEPKRRNKSEG